MRRLMRAFAFVVSLGVGLGAGVLLAAGAEVEERLKLWKRHTTGRGPSTQ